MSDHDHLQSAYPQLAHSLLRLPIADLPTPVRSVTFDHLSGRRRLIIKQDNLSSSLYGGNKVRKLEYLLARAKQRDRETIATFGTVGSHHALATALHARRQGFANIALLSHQTQVPGIAEALALHLEIGSEIVPIGGKRRDRVATLRRALRGRRVAVIPGGGSSWLGTVGFVNAGLELATQIGRGECALPERVYIATGTMGTAVGLALGFALAGLPIDVHAVRISHSNITSRDKLDRLATKTAMMLRRLDRSIPRDLAASMRLRLRHDFFGDGYARSNAATDDAIAIARRDLGLELESTYTGKAMAAVLSDLREPETRGMRMLFWQSYHAAPLPLSDTRSPDPERLPETFRRYLR